MLAVRSFGKAAFLKVRDRAGELQVNEDKLGDAGASSLQAPRPGRHRRRRGPATRTKTGELTVVADGFTILTKALRPLPEKWHGLADVETALPAALPGPHRHPGVRDVFVKRARIVSAIRRFLDERGFLEVETPMLHKPEEAGGAAARPFETHHNALDLDLKLRIATELHLKRLVVGGLERVYEIGRIFRNEGIDRRHNPEFTTLEFYQAYATYHDLMDAHRGALRTTLAREVTGAADGHLPGPGASTSRRPTRASPCWTMAAQALGLSPGDALSGRGLAEALSRAATRERDSEDAWKLEKASPGLAGRGHRARLRGLLRARSSPPIGRPS